MKSWEEFLRTKFGYTEAFQLKVAEELQQKLGDIDDSKVDQLLRMLCNKKIMLQLWGKSASFFLEAAMDNGIPATLSYLQKTSECSVINPALRKAAELLKS